MDWFFYAFFSAVAFCIYSITVRKYLTNGSDAKIFTILNNVITGVILLCFIPFTTLNFSLHWIHVPLLILASMLFALSSLLFTVGRQMEEVSVVSVIRQTSVIWIFFGGFLLFGEEVTVMKAIGTLLILLGTIIVLWNKQHLTFSKGIKYILVATLSLSVNSLITKDMVDNNIPPTVYSALMFLLASLWLLPFLPNRKERLKIEAKLQKGNIFIASFFLAVSIFLLFTGYQMGEVSKVFPVYNVYVVMTVIAGIFFLGEKKNINLKIIGSIIALVGILLLRFF